MLKSCRYCGRIQPRNHECDAKPARQKKLTHIDKFRWTQAWKKKRAAIRDRDKNLCQLCIREQPVRYTFEDIEVHHIVPIHENWDKRLDDVNLISLCSAHHKQAEIGQILRDKLLRIAIENTKNYEDI